MFMMKMNIRLGNYRECVGVGWGLDGEIEDTRPEASGFEPREFSLHTLYLEDLFAHEVV